MNTFALPRITRITSAIFRAPAALLLCAAATVAIAQTPTVITNPAIGAFTGGVNLTARITSASVSGVVVTAVKTSGTFASNGVLRLCRGGGNACETVLDAPYAAGASAVTFPSFTPRGIRQDYYYVQRVDALASTTGGLDPALRSGQMIVIVDSLESGRENAAQVAAGGFGNCTLSTVGAVKCWNQGSFFPTTVAGLPANVASISVGQTQACALASGQVMCWGSNDLGQLGDGTIVARALPVAVIGLPGVVTDVASGGRTTCALIGASASCWGLNTYGEATGGVSPGTPSSVLSATAASVLGAGLAQIQLSDFFGCALKTDQTVVCWGANVEGRLGNNVGLDTRLGYIATPVSGVSAVSLSVSATGAHSCVTRGDASVACWGANASAQLGRGTKSPYEWQPAAATTLTQSATSLVTGGDSTCSILAGGSLKCWGSNAVGQLGIGVTADLSDQTTPPALASVSPIGVSGIVRAASISSRYLCVAVNDGSVRCAGAAGSIGDGSSNPSSVPVGVLGYGPAKAVLPAPTITSMTRLNDKVSIVYSDNLSSSLSPITSHQWGCKANNSALTGTGSQALTNEPTSSTHTVQGVLNKVGPWQCQVRYRTEDGVSAWSAWVTLAARATATPTISSAIYDGEYGTITWRDNNNASDGPIVATRLFCLVQWRNGNETPVPGCLPAAGYCYLDSTVNEPTGTLHTSRLRLPSAAEFGSGSCYVNSSTVDGPVTSPQVPLVAATAPAPTINTGRVVGTNGVLTFADNRSEAAGTIISSAYTCTRLRDSATFSGALTINEPANSQHTVTVPLTGNNLLQDPDSYSCKVRVTPSVGTVSPDSAAFIIGPNSPPVVSNFAFTSNNGVITGAFDINDPERDQVKNIIAYFGSTPRSMECSSGTLGASWDVPRGGGRLQFNASQSNVGCAALTAGAATIYGFVTAQDVNGLYAAIVDAQSNNTPPAPIPVGTTTSYSIVFDAVPTTLAVKQAVDISMRIVDQNGATATQFRGPVRISLSVSGVNFSYEDPNQPAADTMANRVVWFTNGVGRLRAFRLNDEARVRLIAMARADGTPQLTASSSAMVLAQANLLSSSAGLQTKAASTVGYAGVISGTSTGISSLRSGATPNVTINLPAGSEFQTSSFLAEWKAGAIRAYLRNTFTNADLPVGGVAASTDGLSVSFNVPVDNYTLIFKRGTALLPGGEPMQVPVSARGFSGRAWMGSFLLDSAKRRLILVHGIFGSRAGWTSPLETRGGCYGGTELPIPNYAAIAPDMPKNLCERSADERTRGVWSDSSCDPSNLKFVCTSNGDTSWNLTAGLWDALATKFTALGYKVVYAPWDWRLPPASAATSYLEEVVVRESLASGQPVDILAHSMGGLVALNFLQSSQFRRRVDRVVLLGTPIAGSVNAYGLMEVADPLGFDGVATISESFYASVAKKLYENCFMGDKGAGTFADDRGNYKQTRAARRQAFRECAPSGIYLYPDRDYLPFTKGTDTGGQLVAHIPPGSVSRGVFTGANVPNDLVGVAPYAECVADTAARSGTLTIPVSAKSRVTLILSDELGGLGTDGRLIGTKDSVTQAGLSVNSFSGVFAAPMWSSLTSKISPGDGTVPLRGQRERLAAFLGTTFDNVDRNCSRVGKFKDHAGLTKSFDALRMAELSLPLALAKTANISASASAMSSTTAAVVPILSLRVEGASAATLRNGSLPDVGVLPDGSRRDTATNASGSVAVAALSAAEISVSVDNPALGGSIAMIYRSDTNNNTALVKTVTSYSDSAAVLLSKRKTLLVRAGVSAQMNIWLDATTALFSADVVAPAPVPTVTTRPGAASTRILWAAPATTPVAIAGYRVYAARSQDDAWTLIGSVPAGTFAYDAPYPAASITQPEWNFIVVSADSQDRYSEVLELGSNAVRNDIEANFGSARGTPGALVASAAIPLPNNVPVTVSVSGGQMRVNGGAWAPTPLVINPGDTVALRGLTPTTRGAQQDVVLTTGTSSATFSVLGTPLPFCVRPTRPVAETGAFVRFLKNISGLPLLQGLYPSAEVTSTNASNVETHYRDNLTAYDFNGDNATNVLIDGLLYTRYALGFRGDGLVAGIAVGAARTTAQIEAALAACQ